MIDYICPYCGADNGLAGFDEWESNYEDGAVILWECKECGRSYKITMSISVYYECEEIPQEMPASCYECEFREVWEYPVKSVTCILGHRPNPDGSVPQGCELRYAKFKVVEE